MIRINLLPYRASKKKETANQQIMIMVATILIVLAAVGVIYYVTLGKISTTKQEIERSEGELANLKKKVGEIDKLKKLQADVQKKLDILNQLRKEKTGPTNRLARMSDIVPDKLWLTKYQESGLKVSVSGLAYNEELIAEFMRRIESSQEFGNVELQVSEQQEISGVKLKKFDLSFGIKVNAAVEPKKDAGKQ